MLYQCRAAHSWPYAYRGAFQPWEASARLLLDTCTHPEQAQPEVPSSRFHPAFQTTSSLQSPHWNQYPITGKSAQVLITESRGQVLPLVWSEKIHNFKANLYRLTPERCWPSATSPENEGCKPLSTWKIQILTYCLITKWITQVFDYLIICINPEQNPGILTEQFQFSLWNRLRCLKERI